MRTEEPMWAGMKQSRMAAGGVKLRRGMGNAQALHAARFAAAG